MTDDEIIARADANYVAAWCSFLRTLDGSEIVEGDGVLIANACLPIAWFNIAFITHRLADADGAVRRISAYFSERRLPFIIRIRAGVDAAAEEACERAGIPFSDIVPGMALEHLSAEAPAACEGLQMRRALDAQTLRDHAEVVAAAFDMPLDFALRFASPALLAIPDVELYVGYVDGAPVATSAVIATHRVAGVYNVACLPSHRKRGLGEAMTWHAVVAGAAMGCTMASLHASEMGRPIYERMGFRVVAPYRTFIRPEHRA